MEKQWGEAKQNGNIQFFVLSTLAETILRALAETILRADNVILS
jgi:hypothetical protein